MQIRWNDTGVVVDLLLPDASRAIRRHLAIKVDDISSSTPVLPPCVVEITEEPAEQESDEADVDST